MNRLTFLKSLLALPFAAKAALSAEPSPKWPGSSTDPKVNSRAEKDLAYRMRYGHPPGIHALLYGNRAPSSDIICSPEQKVELEKLFKKLYALKKKG